MARTRPASSCDCRPDRRGRLAILAGTILAGALGTAVVLSTPLLFAGEIVQSIVLVVFAP